jgi:staphylococcal nuclease domain-containing protein 1
MTDISDAMNFHLRIIGDNDYESIESEMEEFDPSEAEELEKPIKKGTICAAKFSVDNNWYRASIVK